MCNLSLEAEELFDGEVELDESYFGGVRKGKRGRGADGKTAVFGILKRNGKVYTIVVSDTKQSTVIIVELSLIYMKAVYLMFYKLFYSMTCPN